MKLSVFDGNASRVPSERPKGTIELTRVGDRFSIARIIITRTASPTDPIKAGDVVYALTVPPNQATRFALVGKIDVNRDGRDDREELKRMIWAAGGVVEFDLPPPEVGEEAGKITPRIDWYVTDDRIPIREAIGKKHPDADLLRRAKLAQRVGEVVKEARREGTAPCRSAGS